MRPDLVVVREAFERWLYVPDPGALYAVLATAAAHRLDGDPTWLQLVSPSSGGKTEILNALSALPEVHHAATLTEAALLSGTPKREKAADAKGGLLRSIGDSGVLCLKDFGSVLSMNRDARAALLAALREIYDGAWTRHVGTDGGRALHWSGKLTLIAGCTPAIDQHHAVIAQLGERFCTYRLALDDASEHARRSLAHARHEKIMRAELRDAVGGFFDRLTFTAPDLTNGDIERLVALSTLVVRCRSAVIRDAYSSREIELVPDAEAPGRVVGTLERMLAGLRVIGVDHEEAWRIVVKIGLDSMPALRRTAIELLLEHDDDQRKTSEIATACGLPTSTTLRVLEDLAAHAVIQRYSGGGQGKADHWQIAAWTAAQYQAATSPETSEVHLYEDPSKDPDRMFNNISGEVDSLTEPVEPLSRARARATPTRRARRRRLDRSTHRGGARALADGKGEAVPGAGARGRGVNIELTLTPAVLDELIERVAAIVLERLPGTVEPASTYLTVAEAADYLRAKPQRVYDLLSARRLTRHKDGSRVLVARAELDAHLSGVAQPLPTARQTRMATRRIA